MITNRKLSATLIGICALAFAHGTMAQPANCDRIRDDQRHLQQAIDQAQPGSTISISGTCDGVSLVVRVDDLTIAGPATLNGTGAGPVLRVQDVGGVILNDLDVSGGTDGVVVAHGRVNALNVTASSNAGEGFSVIQHGSLVCTNCEATNNGQRGLLVAGSATLCGTGVFADNQDGVLAFLGGRIFSSDGICGSTPDLDLVDNLGVGLSLFDEGAVFLDGVELDTSSNNVVGISVLRGSTIVAVNSIIISDDNGSPLTVGIGLNLESASVARLNDDPRGSTSMQNNGLFGVRVVQNSNTFLGQSTVDGNAIVGVLVEDFSNLDGNGTFAGGVACEPGQSSGSLCP